MLDNVSLKVISANRVSPGYNNVVRAIIEVENTGGEPVDFSVSGIIACSGTTVVQGRFWWDRDRRVDNYSHARETGSKLQPGESMRFAMYSGPIASKEELGCNYLDVVFTLSVNGASEEYKTLRSIVAPTGPITPPPPPPGEVPPTPGAPYLIDANLLEITIGWDSVPSAEYYKIHHKGEGIIATVYSTRCVISDIAPGSPYTVAVSACNQYGCSSVGPYKTFEALPTRRIEYIFDYCPELSAGHPYTGMSVTKALQNALNIYIGAGLDVDGIYGPETEAAVREFQKLAGIRVDGIAGCETFNALNNGLQFYGVGYFICNNC